MALVVFGNETCIALEFPEVPIFCKRGLDTGGAGGINQENSRVTMLLMRVHGVDGVAELRIAPAGFSCSFQDADSRKDSQPGAGSGIR